MTPRGHDRRPAGIGEFGLMLAQALAAAAAAGLNTRAQPLHVGLAGFTHGAAAASRGLGARRTGEKQRARAKDPSSRDGFHEHRDSNEDENEDPRSLLDVAGVLHPLPSCFARATRFRRRSGDGTVTGRRAA
jgi:hypothetical protein